MRPVGFGAQAFVAVFFVAGEIAFDETDEAVPFEGHDVRGDAIQEVAVVADDQRAAG